MSSVCSGVFKLVLVLFLSGKAMACADGGWSSYPFILLNPDIFGSRQERPVYYALNQYLVDPVASSGADEWQLSAEWKRELRLKASVAEINDYFFGQLSDSALAVHPFRKEINSVKDLKQFLLYAKKCERQIMFSDFWDETNFVKRLKAMPALIGEGEKLIKQAKTEFWKRKYAFQLVRLAYYSTDHKRFYQYYNGHFGLDKRRSPMDWWASHYYSMVLEQRQEVDSANYVHALVFAHSSNKLSVSRQFYTTKNFDAQLALAANENERGDMMAMRLMTSPFVDIDDLEMLAQQFPNHPRLGLLLAREANKLDHEMGRMYYEHVGYYWEMYEDENAESHASDFYEDLHRFSVLLNDLKKRNTNIAFLDMIRAEVAFMNSHYAEARQLLAGVKSTDRKILFQKQLLELCVLVSEKDLKSEAVQNEAGNRLYALVSIRDKVFFADQMMSSFFQLFSRKLEAAGLPHLTAFSNHYINEVFGGGGYASVENYLDEKNSTGICKSWIAVFNSKNRSRLEQFLCIPFNTDNSVKLCLSRIWFRKGNVEEAYKTVSSIKNLDIYAPQFVQNSFIPVQPYYRAGEPAPEKKGQFREYYGGEYKRMLDVMAKKNKSARDWMNLGAAWYNASSDGETAGMAHYSWSLYPSSLQNKIDVDLWKRSQNCYRQVLAAHPGKEEKAEAVYMLAYLAMMMTDEEEYSRMAGEFEKMNGTSFYRASNCSYTRNGQWEQEGMYLYEPWEEE